jgi:hypothetical protein
MEVKHWTRLGYAAPRKELTAKIRVLAEGNSSKGKIKLNEVASELLNIIVGDDEHRILGMIGDGKTVADSTTFAIGKVTDQFEANWSVKLYNPQAKAQGTGHSVSGTNKLMSQTLSKLINDPNYNINKHHAIFSIIETPIEIGEPYPFYEVVFDKLEEKQTKETEANPSVEEIDEVDSTEELLDDDDE